MSSALIFHLPAVTGTLKLPLVSVKVIASRPSEDIAGIITPGNPMLELLASTTLPEMLAVALVSVRLVVMVWLAASVSTGAVVILAT